jgi:hypothetical protein
VFGLALMSRDGVLVLAGYAFTLGAIWTGLKFL